MINYGAHQLGTVADAVCGEVHALSERRGTSGDQQRCRRIQQDNIAASTTLALKQPFHHRRVLAGCAAGE